MATTTERLAFVVSLDNKDAITGFKGISRTAETELTKVDKKFSGLKSMAGGVFDQLKANGPTILAGAAAAVGAFALKAIDAFQDTALAAGKFSDASGIAVEDASRWIEVAGDLGVSTEAIQGSFMKMNKAIADGKLDEFSSQIVRAADGTVDASASFINVATAIGQIVDPTKRAEAAQRVFGRSYGEIAEIIESDAVDLRAALDGVSEAKIIDERELERAREFRESMDNLKDVGEDLTIAIGGFLVPVITEIGEAATDALGPVQNLVDALGESDISAKDVGSSLFDLAKNVVDTAFNLNTARDALDENKQSSEEARDAYLRLGDESKRASVALYRSADAAEDAGEEAKTAAGYFDDLKDKYKGLKAEIDEEQAWLGLEETMADLREAATEAYTAGVTGADNAGEAARDYQGKLLGAKEEVLNLMGELENISQPVESEILLAVEKGDLDRAYALLSWIKAEDGKTYRTYTVHTVTSGGPGYRPPSNPPPPINSNQVREEAMGGNAAGWTLVGERGPEVVDLPIGSHVTSWPQLRAEMSGASGGTTNVYQITNNWSVGTDPVAAGRAMVEAIMDYERVNSSRWRAA